MLAVALSLLLHGGVFLALVPSSGAATGPGQGSLTGQTIDVMLTASVAATAEVTQVVPLAAVVEREAVSDQQGANQDSKPVTDADADRAVPPLTLAPVELGSDAHLSPQDKAPVKNVDEQRKENHIVEPALTEKTIDIASASLPSGLPPAPGYASGVGLGRQPRLLSEITLEYPSAAGTRDGIVVLRILVSETGTVDNLVVLRANPEGFFEDAALKAFAPAKFSPGEFLGVPVKSQFFVEVDFAPYNRGGVGSKGY
ncbi:exported hypothetical protein [Candidatus Accumulibacter aalborgensis]|uniref:TonB C-terminal domain-containing protein n=1 Tax=Candidatus Accumulibacter aalborgensis TaxID=1860102 RepID=A0A1A8XS76_9PROT|nr:exported hypothetical protein [Candidatus Accumulibacter aalborgensis]